MLPPLLALCRVRKTEDAMKNIGQLSVSTFESISVIFSLRAILGSPMVIKRSKFDKCSYIYQKTAVFSRTMIARIAQEETIDRI